MATKTKGTGAKKSNTHAKAKRETKKGNSVNSVASINDDAKRPETGKGNGRNDANSQLSNALVRESVDYMELKSVGAAVAGAVEAVAAGVGSSHDVAVSVAAGAAGVAAVPAGRASDVASMMENDSELQVAKLRAKIASNWAAPSFEKTDEYTQMSLALAGLPDDLRERALKGAALAFAARPENVVNTPSLVEVCEYINTNYSKEFKAVCGCACPAPDGVRLYSYSPLSVSLINADSDINEFVNTSVVPAGLSASGLVAVVMSVRVLVDVRRRIVAARRAARNNFRNCMAGAARMALKLHLDPAVGGRYFSWLMRVLSATDESELRKVRKNLSRVWAALRECETAIVLAAPAGCDSFGAIEIDGGFVFPASLPASGVPVKVRKLWAKRVRHLSAINTLTALVRVGESYLNK